MTSSIIDQEGIGGTDMLSHDFTSLLHEYSLFQMVSEPTKSENTLDLFVVSNPTLVNERTSNKTWIG